jgi:hypothetical protein
MTPSAAWRIVIVEAGTEYDPQERCSECGRQLWFTREVIDPSSAASEVEGEGGA